MSREHAILHKVVINMDHAGDRHVMCAWDECDRDGYEMHKISINYANSGYEDRIVSYVFCTERHMQFWKNSHRGYGQLPPGYKRSYI